MTTTLDDIKALCQIDDDTGCWHWRGCLSNGKWPRVYAPNHSKPGSPKEAQTGRRAVWQIVSGKAIPEGHRVHGRCDDPRCLNPAHMRCGPPSEWGKHLQRTGIYKGKATRVLANRAIGRARSKLTRELITEITGSQETGKALAARLNLSRDVVSKARRGEAKSFHALANPFAGLMSA
jgi:hypothetical protein